MKILPANLISQKNKMSSADPWLLLLEITIPSAAIATLRLVRNTEDVIFDGETYSKFPFELDSVKEYSSGEIPSITLRVTNINRVLQGYMEIYDGLVGQTATLIVVNAAHLEENYAELTLNFDIVECFINSEWINFSLGAPNPLIKRFPLYRYIGSSCNWRSHFKGAECKYAGPDNPPCNGTLEDCIARGNTINFGGYPGMTGGGLRIA